MFGIALITIDLLIDTKGQCPLLIPAHDDLFELERCGSRQHVSQQDKPPDLFCSYHRCGGAKRRLSIWPYTLILNFLEPVKLEPTLLDPMPTTLILRHRKENLKKCSLTPITGMKGIEFFSYPKDLAELPIVPGTIVLVMGAPPLPARESSSPLLLIDGTWRLAEVMWKQLSHRYGPLFIPYSLPACSTAYPRRQTCCDDPNEGLASIEALYLAHTLLGRPTDGLLDGYHWRESFLERNQALWEQIALEQASGLK